MIASLKGVTFDERETIVDKWLSVFGKVFYFTFFSDHH